MTATTPMTSPTQAGSLADRDLRQRGLVPPEALAATAALIVGVGAVGRQLALQLAALGVPELHLVDFDRVDAVNLAPQGFLETELGRLKVEAVAETCRRSNSQATVRAYPERFRRSGLYLRPAARRLAVFACVDSIETRGFLWQELRQHVPFWADSRMAAEVCRVLTSAAPATDEYYQTTLFTDGEAYEARCTSRSTIYTASIAAGLLVAQFAKWLRGQSVERDLTLNLLSMEMSAG